jgi:hypothetical protein
MLWRGEAASLDQAKARVQELAKTWPADYLIVNLHSGLKIKMSMDGQGGKGGASGASGAVDGQSQTDFAPEC